jgi:hypothetical protein
VQNSGAYPPEALALSGVFKASGAQSFNLDVDAQLTKWRQPREVRRNRAARWLGGLALLGTAGFLLLRSGAHAEASASWATCSDVSECRRQLSEAEFQLESCALACSDEQRSYLSARNQFRDALELQAAADHRAELASLAERQQLERAKAESAREQQALLEQRARDQEHEQRLALLEAQTQQRTLELAADHERRVRYLSRLTLEQRRQRLTACHDQHRADCDELAELLIESAARPADRRSVVDLHERLATGLSVPTSPAVKIAPIAPKVPEQVVPAKDVCCEAGASDCACVEGSITLAVAAPG